MADAGLTIDRPELARFLRACRERISPGDVGLSAGPRRRTPGLRRAEVATLADVSVDYYIRLEQGRGPKPSRQVLAALARALRLDGDRRDHLFHLAGEAPPPPGPSDDHVRPGVLRLMDRLDDAAAFVVNDRYDVLAWNPLAAALMRDYGALPPRERNILWLSFTDAEGIERFPPEEVKRLRASHIADVRVLLAKRPDDRRLQELVARLRAISPEFVRLWEAPPEVQVRRNDHKTLLHPLVGRVELDCEVMLMPEHDQRLIVLSAEPGTAAYEALRLLNVVGLQSMEPDAERAN